MAQNQTCSDDTIRFARLLLDPEDYCDIVGISLKNWAFGPRVGGAGGNESQHKFWARMRNSGKATQGALQKFIKFLEVKHQLSFLSPLETPLKLGAWSGLEDIIRLEAGEEGLEGFRQVILASDNLQKVAEFGGPKALAAELHRAPTSSFFEIFHVCADELEKNNSINWKAVLAPIHIFVASYLIFSWLVETHPDKAEGFLAVRKLVCGNPTHRGPQFALARWLATAQNELGFKTKTQFYAALSPNQDPENARIEWSKVGNGRDVPPLPRLRDDLKRIFKDSPIHNLNSELYEQLDLGLWYCSYVARSYKYLQKHNVTKARKVFLVAATEVERARLDTNHVS